MRRGARYEAKQQGLKHYFTDLPCNRGHISKRKVSDSKCLECARLSSLAIRQKDPERHREAVRKFRKLNPEKRRKHEHEGHARHREKRNAYSRAYNKRNRERLSEYNRQWLKNNPHKQAQYFTLKRKIANLLRVRLRSAVKRKQKAGSAIRDLGCSIDQFENYIAAKFEPGMTWENHGTVWHLDHVKPLKDFDLTERDQFLAACHFSNIQPLELLAHREKTAREKQELRNARTLSLPFQASP